MKYLLLLLVSAFSFTVQAAPMFEDGANVGSVRFASSYVKKAEKCESEGYKKCPGNLVAADVCPYSAQFAKNCLEKELYKYGVRGLPCTKTSGYYWRGLWTECLDEQTPPAK